MSNIHTTLISLFTNIADAIRSKTGSTANIVADNFPTEIGKIVTLSSGSSDATATASQILTGKTAYVKGSKVTGTMANQGAKTSSLNCGGSYTIPAGYHNGSGKVTANSLASQTDGTAVAGDLANGKTAYVNGEKITGTSTKDSTTTDATATDREICQDKTAYVNGEKITGNGMIYKKTDLTGWYGKGAVSGTTASCNYVRLLKHSGFTIIGGWLNIKQGTTEYQLRIGGAGTSSTFTAMSNNQSANSPGCGTYNGYIIAYIPSTKCNSLGISDPDSIEIELYYRQF